MGQAQGKLALIQAAGGAGVRTWHGKAVAVLEVHVLPHGHKGNGGGKHFFPGHGVFLGAGAQIVHDFVGLFEILLGEVGGLAAGGGGIAFGSGGGHLVEHLMDVDKPEADTQAIGDMLIAVEGIHRAVGGGGAEAGDAEDPSGVNDLPGTQNLQAIFEIVPFVAGKDLIVTGLAGDTGYGDGAGEAGQGRDGDGLAEALGTFQHPVITGNTGLRNDNITGGHGGSNGVPLRFGVFPVVGAAEGDGLHHLAALRQMILQKPKKLLLLLGVGQAIIAGLEGVAFAKAAGTFIVIKMFHRD